jgi:hypothetical protein
MLSFDDVALLADGLYGVEDAYPDTRADKRKCAVSGIAVGFEHIRTRDTAYKKGYDARAYKGFPAVFVEKYSIAFSKVNSDLFADR